MALYYNLSSNMKKKIIKNIGSATDVFSEKDTSAFTYNSETNIQTPAAQADTTDYLSGWAMRLATAVTMSFSGFEPQRRFTEQFMTASNWAIDKIFGTPISAKESFKITMQIRSIRAEGLRLERKHDAESYRWPDDL